jgi:acetyl esterase/lipase
MTAIQVVTRPSSVVFLPAPRHIREICCILCAMRIQTIPLLDDNPAIRLDAYWLHNSPEYQSGQLRPAIIVCPGGGYMFLSDREAEPIAMRFLAQGYHAFVLRYSVQTAFPAPMLDLARAIALVRRHAAEWLIDPDRIVVCGFSAGGHLAASLGVLWDKPLLSGPLGVAPEDIRPNALLLCYAMIEMEVLSHQSPPGDESGQPVFDLRDSIALALGPRPSQALRDQYRLDLHVSPATPPTFLWHTAEDQIVPANHALRFALALAANKVPYELHIYEKGVHGLALADEVTAVPGDFIDTNSQAWVQLALNWLKLPRGA